MKKEIDCNIDELVSLAWQDECPFEAIHSQLGLSEAEVIRIMRGYLKRRSFRVWRTRVSGRQTKHRAKHFHSIDHMTINSLRHDEA